LKAVLYTIDQGGKGFPVTAVNFQDRELQYSIDILGGSYDGKLSADSKSIAGTWTQGSNTTPLILELVTPEKESAVTGASALLPEIAADATPEYDVGAIKPSNPDSQETPFRSSGRVLTARKQTLGSFIEFAYWLQARQVINAPSWVYKDGFDVDTKMVIEGQPSDQQVKAALRKLLEDRFKLTYHHDQKELAAYEIVLAKDGPKNLTKAHGWGGDPNSERHTMTIPKPGIWYVWNFTLQDLGNILGRSVLDKPVINRTGLTERFDFTLMFTPDEFQLGAQAAIAPAESGDAPPSLFLAMQRQLGLKLQPVKGPIDAMVIDHVERPSQN